MRRLKIAYFTTGDYKPHIGDIYKIKEEEQAHFEETYGRYTTQKECDDATWCKIPFYMVITEPGTLGEEDAIINEHNTFVLAKENNLVGVFAYNKVVGMTREWARRKNNLAPLPEKFYEEFFALANSENSELAFSKIYLVE